MKLVTRRSFVRDLGIVCSIPWIPRIVRPKNRTLGVALVGLGYYSRDLLAPALQHTKYCALRGIVTGSPEKIPVWQQKYNIPDANVYSYESFEDIVDNDDIDVIYIVLPPSMHAEYSIRAAEMGKHVWCEKPMAVTSKECRKMIHAAEQNKVQLAIGYRMQHEPNTQTIMDFATEKPFGQLTKLSAKAGYRDGRSNHWKQQKAMGGGALYDMGVYPINALRYATGLNPISVLRAKHTTTRPDIYHEVDETTSFVLRFPGEVLGHGETSFGKSINGLRVDCQNGWYELNPMQSYSGVQGQTSNGKKLNKPIANQQSRQMDDDALAIIQKRSNLVPGEEGWRDIKIVEAIYQSAKDNREILMDWSD